MGTGRGLSLYDDKKGVLEHRHDDPQNRGGVLDDQVINKIYQDGSGNIWVATDAMGLGRYDRERDLFIIEPLDRDLLAGVPEEPNEEEDKEPES